MGSQGPSHAISAVPLDSMRPTDLDAFMMKYNEERTHQGKRCQGRTPMQTFLDRKSLAQEKRIA